MKIAIVGPSPAPYAMGGMEYLLWGLYEHINKDTEHMAELIKVPVDESGFWPLINSYRRFYELKLDHFDMVISTKYPAWMVRHRNHVCYMGHRLRGLYDTYHLSRLPMDVVCGHPLVNKIIGYVNDRGNTIRGLFSLLDELYAERHSVPQRLFDFPGPFIRQIIHFLDDKALSLGTVTKFAAISGTVKARKEYFPDDADVSAIYPPSFLTGYKNGGYDYLFTVSRLDSAKRVSLMIQAMKHVKGDIKLKIAGTGPMEEELRAMAASDSRIEFLGFVNDDSVTDYYANAKAVLFMPYEEDYGLVTIEAMMSRKPVITCTDSGGPCEFVEHGVNGFVARPDPESIAEQINSLLSLTEESIRAMGDSAYSRVRGITWKSVLNELLEQKPAIHRQTDEGTIKAPVSKPGIGKGAVKSRKKITVTSTFPVYPPRGGGQARVYHLYKNITSKYDVEIISFAQTGNRAVVRELGDHYREISIPKSSLHTKIDWSISRKVGIPVSDAVLPLLSDYSKDYGHALEQSMMDADLTIASHPYLINEILKCRGDMPVAYEAQDVEYYIKKQAYPDNAPARELLDIVHEAEGLCCNESSLVLTCTDEDGNKLHDLYGTPLNRMITVPNGVDCSAVDFIARADKDANKKKAKVQGEKFALFIGSWHQPNIEACELIFGFAPRTPEIKYLIMGSQCMVFRDRKLPDNVILLGTVDEKTKAGIYGIVDVALNPMISGSGTNLKMFDYMASGIPVVSTEFGARGIGETGFLTIAGIEDFPEAVRDTLNSSSQDMLISSRQYIENNFDWRVLARKLTDKLDEIL